MCFVDIKSVDVLWSHNANKQTKRISNLSEKFSKTESMLDPLDILSYLQNE